MALRVAKKDVKKSSYYVWFLGAQEARSATGARQALAALSRLEARAASTANPASPPTKVTLQVSGRGLKIVQNVAGRTVKHLLPADSVTEARCKGDAVVCILLLYNPATRCPLHAHAYRCDSEQTAQALCSQLRAVAGLGPEEDDEPDIPDDVLPSDVDSREIELPRYNENRHNSNENRSNSYDKRIISRDDPIDPRDRIDHRDRIDPRLDRDARIDREPRMDPRITRDPRMEHIDGRHHENRVPAIEMRLAPEAELAAERLAAELRTRLAGREPLLLPPRDYDTSRRGPSAGPQVAVKRNNRAAVVGSSAGSSGIGSDLAPSPERPHTSSEEDWGESTAYMLHEGYDVSRSPPRRARSPSPSPKLSPRAAGSVSPKDRFHVAKEKFLNLEREKLNEELEKRAQIRRNLNMALARGPLLPSELKNERRYKWDDDDDGLIERRAEMPRAVARNDPRDIRRSNPRDDRENSRGREREVRDFRDSRHSREIHDSRDYREPRGSRGLRDPLDMRELRDQRPVRDETEFREYREGRESRDYREFKDVKESRDSRYARDMEARNIKEFREPSNNKESRDHREVRDYKEPRDFKYGREYREPRETREIEEPVVRNSRERTPQLEQRYYEYKGERNDKYFDNRYSKHDSRSDDEGVESEKQFEEIRYVPHVEVRRREPEPKSIKGEVQRKEQPIRDGRIELLEERQRQIESGRMGRALAGDTRFDRNLETPVRESNKDWDVVRRQYAEADRPRRDARARHSYAEPVARTRVGMATVAPF